MLQTYYSFLFGGNDETTWRSIDLYTALNFLTMLMNPKFKMAFEVVVGVVGGLLDLRYPGSRINRQWIRYCDTMWQAGVATLIRVVSQTLGISLRQAFNTPNFPWPALPTGVRPQIPGSPLIKRDVAEDYADQVTSRAYWVNVAMDSTLPWKSDKFLTMDVDPKTTADFVNIHGH